MRRQTLWKCAVHKPRTFHIDDHVYHGPSALLFGHVSVVRHLERGVQCRTIVFAWLVNLDAMEGYLHEASEEDIRQALGNR